jgi:MFS family permease
MLAAVTTSWSLLLGMGLLMVGNGLQGTLLGVRASLEGFATSLTGVMMSAYFAGFLVGSTLAPKLVARVGHVRVFAALASLASTVILIHALFVNPLTWTLMRLASGFCFAGLYVVAESWLNAASTNETRGQLLSIYMVVVLVGMTLGQVLLNLAHPSGVELFILISILVSLALIPMLLSMVRMPRHDSPAAHVGLRELYRVSPTGVVGIFATMMAQGACFGMGAVYASAVGLSVGEISLFMSLILVGGALLQWPIGRLSDAFDRRQVLTLVTLAAGVAALLAGLAIDGPRPAFFALVWLFGGMHLPMYALCIAYTNDYLRPEQIVEASGALVLAGGLGASFGPVIVALAMAGFGPHAFFVWIAIIHGAIGLFALYRMTRRAAPPLAEQGAYVALPPRPTPTVGTMWAEVAGEPGDESAAPAEGVAADPVSR